MLSAEAIDVYIAQNNQRFSLMTRLDGSPGGFGISPDEEYVTLVDLTDRVVGRAEKLRAHRDALLHRAFSVLVYDSQDRLLLQRRHPDKYHSGGLWSNTACGHPRPQEDLANAAARRLFEEMGITCDLAHKFGFVYRSNVAPDLTEYEYDHVFVGRYDGDPDPNAEEVDGWRWESPKEIAIDLADRPRVYTTWFRILFGHLAAHDALDFGADEMEKVTSRPMRYIRT